MCFFFSVPTFFGYPNHNFFRIRMKPSIITTITPLHYNNQNEQNQNKNDNQTKNTNYFGWTICEPI